jgi:WD repeat-containing protein 22
LGEADQDTPLRTFKGHVSNIFCIEFDSTNTKFYSCGNDGFLLQYDLEYDSILHQDQASTIANDINLAHEEAVTKLSICPDNDNIVLTAR